MFEYCKYYECVYYHEGICSFTGKVCERPVDDSGTCKISGLHLRCPFAFHHKGTLVCGADTSGTERLIRGLPKYKYAKKLAVDDLLDCILKLKNN